MGDHRLMYHKGYIRIKTSLSYWLFYNKVGNAQLVNTLTACENISMFAQKLVLLPEHPNWRWAVTQDKLFQKFQYKHNI